MTVRTIKTDTLARVEGEGGFTIRIRDGRVESVQFRIDESPRLFEAFLRGRSFTEVPDLVARICGICPVAHQLTAAQALESAIGLEPAEPVRLLRRLLVCGEWIESHALHVFLLHAPDFLGTPDAIRMAQDHPQAVRSGLKLKQIGNEIMALVGGREIHPVNVRVGGLFRAPSSQALAPLKERLKEALDAAVRAVGWVSRLPFAEFESDHEGLALRHDTEYPMNAGELASTEGWHTAEDPFEARFIREQHSYSNALHSRKADGGIVLVGPLARFNLNFDRLSPLAQETARSAGLVPPCRNPFQSILVRSVELVYACEEALRLIEAYEPFGPSLPAPSEKLDAKALPQTASGFSLTEAPRGTLYHRYETNAGGLIVDTRIVTPTAQNLAMIEEDLRRLVSRRIDTPRDALVRLCEQAVRNHDPCISCATHRIVLEG